MKEKVTKEQVVDHDLSYSIYFDDPDGNKLELVIITNILNQKFNLHVDLINLHLFSSPKLQVSLRGVEPILFSELKIYERCRIFVPKTGNFYYFKD